MIKGLYTAASAMVAGVARQKTLAHNVANMETPGFKQILTSLKEYEKTGVVYSPDNVSRSAYLQYIGELGLGVDLNPEETDYEIGGFKFTGNPLDLCINGSGFFRVLSPDGEELLTRDGRFIRDSQGTLTMTDGSQVLDTNGQPITIEDGELSIRPDGTITVDGQDGAQIGISVFANPTTDLERAGDNSFRAINAATTDIAAGDIQQNYLEMSNVNASHVMTQMVMIARSYEAAQRMVQVQDEVLGRTLSTLGRL